MEERERVLVERLWFPVARSADLAAGPVAGRLLDTDLVVFRGAGGVTVAADRCPHRGAALSRGRMESDDLECAYHGWRFGGDGRCTLVPSLPGGSPPKVTLTTFSCRERYGYVWACLRDAILDLPALAALDQGGWQLAHGGPHDLHCGYRQLTENFRDMSHFPFVHKASMGPSVQREVAPYQVARAGWTLSWVLPTDLGGTAFGGNRSLTADQTLTYTVALPSSATVHTVFPDGGQRLVVQLAAPISADGEWCRQFYLVGIDAIAAGHPGASVAEMFRYERQIFEEDWPVVESQRPREAPLDVESQAHTRADRFSLAYRQLYRELMDETARRG
jgi:phenylpropionate dioxygenase-like ring-hydroxylating dioxygenase large terminal subunit